MSQDTPRADPETSKARVKSAWEFGDFGQVSPCLEKGALEFLERFEIPAGSRLLDVGCGTGQLAIAAAVQGLRVTALDVAGHLVEQARARAAQEGIELSVDAGDAESLRYADGSFDVVASLLGAMFAPRPERVAAEMIRVCKPGGRIVMGNWTPEGHVGQMFRVLGKYAPPLPTPSPLLWGDEPTCRQRLAACTGLTIRREMFPLESPLNPGQVVDRLIQFCGPITRVHDSLNDADRQALRADLTVLWARNNKGTNGATRVMAEYLAIGAVTPPA